MNKALQNLNSCDLYVALGCIYYMQGVLYPPGIINQAIQSGMILWALVVAVKYIINFKYSPSLLNVISLLVIMYCVYGSLYMLSNESTQISEGGAKNVGSYLYLQNALNSLLPFYILYSFSEQGKLSVSRICSYCIIYLLLFVAVYFRYHEQMLLQAALVGIERKEFTNNTGYFFIMLIPYLFFFKNQLFRLAMLVIIMVLTVMCMKRGAILIGGVSFIWFLIANFQQNQSPKKKAMILVFSVGVICSAISYIEYKQDSSKYFRSRIEQTQKGDASGRNMIYPKIWNAVINDESVAHLLVGRGANSTVRIAGNYAHQDWLELACNNGLIGIILALSFYITIFSTAIFHRQDIPQEYYMVLLMFGFMMFAKTMFSMSIASMKIWEIMPIAYILHVIRNSDKNLCARISSERINNPYCS